MKTQKSLLLSAAVSALMLTGCPDAGTTKAPPAPATTGGAAAAGDKHVCKGKAADGKNECASAEYKHECKTKNTCKGQGGCGATLGKNECKGKGECAVPKK